jgi:DNA-binding IclR family transcriptional regulator
VSNNLYSTTFLKAFDILDCFQDDAEELGISDISTMINLPVSSVHRILQSMEFEGFILQNAETRKYRLGTRCLVFGAKSRTLDQCRIIAEKHVDRLSRQTKETVNLSVRTTDQIQHIYKADSSYVLRPNFSLYMPFPAHNTSVGRVFLAELDDAALRWVHQKNREEISLSEEDFLSMLHRVKTEGYALDDEEFNKGLRCVGAPVRLRGGGILFAVSISAPAARVDDRTYAEFRRLVKECAEAISAEIQNVI